ncbi:MAG: VWA domain-containing protein, partial [Clostridia bacterium]|nr:VWA domain-containing protein [Clostridia bacterium]
MKKTKLSQRLISIFLCAVLLVSHLPITAKAASAPLAKAITNVVTDPGTADAWEHMMGTDIDGNRYAGRVWVDKSVFKNGDVAKFNSKNDASSSYQVALAEDEAFQVVFSALGSTMSTKESITSTGPMDIVLVLDTSTSMDDTDSQGVTRLQRTIEAANLLLDDLLNMKNVRIAIVTYNEDSETVLALNEYTNGVELVVTDYFNNGSSDAGVVTAYDNNRRVLGNDDGYTMGTNLQSGIDRGFNILANATGVDGRIPVAIVLTDGQANRASQEGFYEIASHSDKNGTSTGGRNLYLSTLLNAAYNKTKIEAHYNTDATVYTVGVDVSNNQVARLLMNPADPTYGFNAQNRDREISAAYQNFNTWKAGQNVTYSRWTFDHGYPTQNGAVTDAKIAANINYANVYYDVSNADIADTFEQIYQELSSGVFNPISSTTTTNGGTG